MPLTHRATVVAALGEPVAIDVDEPLGAVLHVALAPLHTTATAAQRIALRATARGWTADFPSGRRRVDGADMALYEALSELNDIAAATSARSGRAVLHGTCVAHREHAWCLVGPSGAGKSTLAAALCREGGALVAEEVTAIEAGTALPYPRALALRPPTLELLGLPAPAGPYRFVHPWTPPAVAAAPVPLAGIALLRREAGAEWNVRTLGADEALFRLAQNTLGARGVEREMFRRVEHLARHTTVVEVTYAHAPDAARHWLQTLYP